MAEKAKDQMLASDSIVGLTLISAKALSDYLEKVHGIVPVVAVPGASGGEAQAADTEFDVILTEFGDNKISVLKVVRSITGLGLKEAKDLVEGLPKPLKQAVPKEEAENIKKEIEGAGGRVTISGELNSGTLEPSPPVTETTSSRAVWTKKQNARRIELLMLKSDLRLSDSESSELERLQTQCAAFLDEKAPLPFDKLTQLEDELRRAQDDHAS